MASKIDRLLEHGPTLGMPLVRRLGDDLFELRISKYRVYFKVGDGSIVVLACGEKDTQSRDIARARGRA